MKVFVFLLVLVCGCWSQVLRELEKPSMFDMSDRQIHVVLKAHGFYDGDVDEKWSAKTMEAFKKFTKKSGFEAQHKIDKNDYYWRQQMGSWLLKNNPEELRIRSIGVYVVQFDIGACAQPNPPAELSCSAYKRSHEYRMEAMRKKMYEDPEDNLVWYMAMSTRGIHRFHCDRDSIHSVSLPDEAKTKGDVLPYIHEAVGYDPRDRYARRMYIFPSTYTGKGRMGGLAIGADLYFHNMELHTLLHELGHSMGLDHDGKMVDGRFSGYQGKTSFMSGTGGPNSPNAIGMDVLRVISDNLLELKTSQRGIAIDSLTSVSQGYSFGDRHSPIVGKKAAVYRPENPKLVEYYVEWREQLRQDKGLSRELVGKLIVTHIRRSSLTDELDAVLGYGESWTSPKGDFKITHVSQGKFDVEIGPPTNVEAEVKFYRSYDHLQDIIQARNRMLGRGGEQ